MDLDDARAEAGIKIGELFKGVDLVGMREQRRQTQREALQALTLQECVEKYFRKRSEPGRYWPELKDRFENEVIPKLGRARTVVSITKQDIRSLLDAKAPGSARTLFVGLAPFFKWCVSEDIIPVSPMSTLQRPEPADVRDRVLTDIELKVFWTATGKLPLFGPFYRVLLLTGQRREEVGGMRWSEIDDEWIIPKERTKNGKEHLVHLSVQTLSVLNKVPRLKSDFVFTTTLDSSISGYGRAKARLDELMQAELGNTKLKQWRVHDLRRTAATGMAALGFQPYIIERVLNHVSGVTGGLVGVYQRFEYAEERKMALYAWGNRVEQLVSGAKKPS
jgi:integrase